MIIGGPAFDCRVLKGYESELVTFHIPLSIIQPL